MKARERRRFAARAETIKFKAESLMSELKEVEQEAAMRPSDWADNIVDAAANLIDALYDEDNTL